MTTTPSRKRFSRRTWSAHELEVLRATYVLNSVPSVADKESLAALFQCDVKSVRFWFQNQRQRNSFRATLADLQNALFLMGSDDDDDVPPEGDPHNNRRPKSRRKVCAARFGVGACQHEVAAAASGRCVV